MAFPKRLLVDHETLVLSMRPHAIVLIPPALIGIVVVAGWIVILPNLPDGSAGDTTRWVLLAKRVFDARRGRSSRAWFGFGPSPRSPGFGGARCCEDGCSLAWVCSCLDLF